MHNTRLFPKNRGADAYRLSGVASRCDWAILTDQKNNKTSLRGNFTEQPQTVFLSLRSIFHAIPFFFEEILPKINNRFVLISGSEDITLPNQIDSRWRVFSTEEKKIINTILDDPRLIHWFVENLDERNPNMSPLPVGYVLADGQSNLTKLEAPETPIKDRPLKVLCAHRVRDGKQWVMRRKLTELCKNKFQPFTTILTNEVSESAFQNLVQEHPFVICAQGGGLDPSPKAWLTLANGSIPIIKSSPLDDAYSQLPVAFVDEWNEECLSLDKMHEWIEDLAPYFEDDDLRIQTLHRLSLDYWWNRIVDMTISPLTDAY